MGPASAYNHGLELCAATKGVNSMDRLQLKELLKKYMSIPRLSGYEREVADTFAADLSVFSENVTIDWAGNVIASFPGNDPDAPTVMVFAHMDSIGFIVTNIDEHGYLRFDRVGGVPEKALQGLDVRVRSENGTWHNGVIGIKAYHVLDDSGKGHVDSIPSLFVDLGADSREDVLDAGIQVGCPVVYGEHFKELMNDRISGTYTDGASGMTSLLHLAEFLKHDKDRAATVYITGTVMEEFNARGAMLAQRTAHADLAICLMGPGAGDTPDLYGTNLVRLGGGIGVNLMNFHGKGTLNGNIIHAGLLSALKDASARTGIPIQRQAARGALSDTAYLQLEDLGVACMDMGTPDRYSHGPMEVLDLKDLERCAPLVHSLLLHIDRSFERRR